MKSAFSSLMFDLDGVLADTERLKGMAHVSAIGSLGYHACLKRYVEVMGQSSTDVMQHLLSYTAAREVDPVAYQSLFNNEYAALLEKFVSPMPGALELLSLVTGSFHIAIVSSSDRGTMDYILNRLDLIKVPDAIVSSNDVNAQKPCPDPYLLAAARLGAPNPLSIAFEDTEAGVNSALSAGSPVIAVRHELNQNHNFANANLEVTSLLQLDRITEFLAGGGTYKEVRR